MKALVLNQHFTDKEHLTLNPADISLPKISAGKCLVKVSSSGINPSDALALVGYFKHAQLPRIPGRDFSGVIVEGHHELIGRRVWGSGGAAGIDFDGTNAEYILIPDTQIAEVPENIDLVTAGAQTLPFVTAYYSLVSRASIKSGETVVIIGALGQVGRAAMSIATWLGCNTIAVIRGESDLIKAEELGWQAVDSEAPDLAEKIIKLNHNSQVNVVFNSIGNLLWKQCMTVLAPFGRLITIGAREGTRDAMINLFDLYRANIDLIGVNSVTLGYEENAKLLNEMKPGFESGKLQTLPVHKENIYSLSEATKAYKSVLDGSQGRRVVLKIE